MGNFTGQWHQLSDKEKEYAYYLSKASFAGGKMVFHQISYESPAIFLILQGYFSGKNFEELSLSALKNNVSKEEFDQFCAYAGGFYSNMGNYFSSGGQKFIPEMSKEKFKTILESNPLYLNRSS